MAEEEKKKKKITLMLDPAEVHLIEEALDSHIYWQLSSDTYRNDGSVTDPGSDDPEEAKEIAETRALQERITAMVVESEHA